ncbi:DUF998 domain-containing protein [Streptomyces hesseae]|uniref:DUF998 domain-containing protein n=1 Tax=Streptomyces hesseae TaxID=3075519 RepID=A0ABU2SG01_9ACTN|nr:DUF998 domain-containing protein [Streptomyces sp. DSM 40473]MDT0447906.1 DUF998 domain-containing protein [Streptomyces sp. DSM 40473]
MPRPTRDPHTARAVWAPLLLTTAAVVYNDWVLEFLLPTGLDPRHSYVSELYADDQRFHGLFGGIELVAAALVVAGALLARGRSPGRWEEAGWWSLVAFGAASVADVAVPMRCAPSVESPCEAVNPWHTTTSALVHLALFASMALLVTAAALGTPRRPVLRRWGPWVLGAALTTALATVGPLFGRPGWHGVPQRAHLLLVGVWFVLLAAALRAEARPRPGATRGPDPPDPRVGAAQPVSPYTCSAPENDGR